jgi:copper transport protein
LALVVVALVASFRFTTPPRSLFTATAGAPLFAMASSTDYHNMANVNLTPGKVGVNNILIQVTDNRMQPIAIQGVTVAIANPDAGIEPITRDATKSSGTIWEADGLTLSVPGIWNITAYARISDFSEIELDARVAIAR